MLPRRAGGRNAPQGDAGTAENALIQSFRATHMITTAYGEKIVIQKDKTGIKENAISVLTDGIELYMPFEGLVDVEEEKKRQEEEIKRLQAEVDRCNKILSNEGFLKKAPQAKIDEEREKLKKYQDMLNKMVH